MANKLALIYPSMHNEIFASDLLYSPLALAYVGAYTPDDWEIKLYDEYVGNFIDPDEIDADLVAMSALTPNIRRAYYLADKFKARGIKTVCGSAHVSALPNEALQHFDTVVIGEAEPIWPTLIQDFEKGKMHKIYDGGMSSCVNNIRLPRRDLIHPNYQFQSFITSKGCPFKCDYCYLSVFDKKKYRVLPVDAIIEDFDQTKDDIDFAAIVVDENVSGYSESDYVNRMELFERMIKKNYKFVWGAQATIDIYKKTELLDLMYRAGCRGLFIGLEATEDIKLHDVVNKGFADRINYKEAIDTIHKHKIAIIGSFMIGLDNQNMEYLKKLPKKMQKLKVEYPRLFFLTAWPGTPLYQRMKEQDRIKEGWDHVRKDNPSMVYKQLPEEMIHNAENDVMDKFFTKTYIFKIILRWIFRRTGMIKFFLKLLKGNVSKDARKLKEEQKEKEKNIKKLVDEHFQMN